MKHKLFGYFKANRKGLALITVLGVVTLATILILALFSVSDAEFKSSKSYQDGAISRQMADSAVNLVVSQIQSAATGQNMTGDDKPSIWASQPGAVRVYNPNGIFRFGRKLFSSASMVVEGHGYSDEKDFAEDSPNASWNTMPAQWVDMNEPVIQTPDGGGAPQVYFPIIDPRASVTYRGLAPVEGFTYNSTSSKGGALSGVVSGGDPDNLRVPMPVEWLYMLKDGSLGTVTQPVGGADTPQPAKWAGIIGSVTPTDLNPIVGRVAFWTDDETCKINVNTAAEPGYWNVPTAFHERSKSWADAPPVVYEYQRWPGHPATVALSSVLAPNAQQLPSQYDGDSFQIGGTSIDQYIALKNAIYDLAPQIGIGGSVDGTRIFDLDDFGSQQKSENVSQLWPRMQAAMKEHQFVSVDEMIFQSRSVNGKRVATDIANPLGNNLVSAALLQRAKFFLSASSTAPETNMFGYPRVAIWPVPDASLGSGTQNLFRTPYDEAIAKAATVGNTAITANTTNTYYFSRRDYASSLTDIGRDFQSPGLVRNGLLMDYLDMMMKQRMPGGTPGASFWTKYGNSAKESRQILVQIFDYIRCTNLYDSFLEDRYMKQNGGQRDLWDNNDGQANQTGAKSAQDEGNLWRKRPAQLTYYTYTPPRFDTIQRVGDLGGVVPTQYQSQFKDERVPTGAYPGHGQVKPIEWTKDQFVYKGFGRLPTISEVSLQFICTGDGKPDNGSFKFPESDKRSGGRTAQRIDPTRNNERVPLVQTWPDEPGGPWGVWYSNFPPKPTSALFQKWGCRGAAGSKFAADRHPGSDPENWNCTLDVDGDGNGIDLKSGDASLGPDEFPAEKRIQVALSFELFVPAVGYTKYVPDFTLVVNGQQVANLEVMDSAGKWRSLFNTTEDKVIQSSSAFFGSKLGQNLGSFSANGANPMGGMYGPKTMLSGRRVNSSGGMPKDSGYQDASSGDVHTGMLNYPLVSSFFTVERNKPIRFRAKNGTGIKVDIYASHDWQGKENKKNSTSSQSVMVKFPEGDNHTAPEPWLVVYSAERRVIIDSNGNQTTRAAVNACRWWAFNAGGAVARFTGRPPMTGENLFDWNSVRDLTTGKARANATTFGRFFNQSEAGTNQSSVGATNNGSVPGGLSHVYGYSPSSGFGGTKSGPKDFANRDNNYGAAAEGGMVTVPYFGTDSIRSIVPVHGDYRLLAARKDVPASVWKEHRLWTYPNELFAHSLSGSTANSELGSDNGHVPNDESITPVADNRLVKGAWYPIGQVPDAPLTEAASTISDRSRDFDNAPGDMRDGPYINKPDEGNLSVAQFWYGKGTGTDGDNQIHRTRNAYFLSTFMQMPSTNAYFTPNRMISSPGVFGSLPTGVFGSQPGADNPDAQNSGVPWRTLLFRADTNGHLGAPAWSGGLDPADHYIMDLFWMPVIQPYAISDSYATAGKINMNFQMLPFGHITRNTALQAALKGEMVTAYSMSQGDPRSPTKGVPNNANPLIYKQFKDEKRPQVPRQFWSDSDGMGWHHSINRDETLKQLNDRFFFKGSPLSNGGLMRTPSQICEVHLIPQPVTGNVEPTVLGLDAANIKGSMDAYWRHNNLTGDNTRENPYARIYQKLTTRSNTYRVYFRAQTLRKARSVSPQEVDETKDTVTAEYRGSALIERYLDFSATTALPNFVGAGVDPFTMKSLENYYHYRVLETKQFAP